MTDQDIREDSYNVSSSNSNYLSASALQIRLDPTREMENFEMFLKGEKIISYIEGGELRQKVVKFKPKATDEGIQAILGYLGMILSPQTVQGNFMMDGERNSPMYHNYICEINIDIASFISENQNYWKIRDEDYNLIIDTMMAVLQPFFTRPIGNKERDSYEHTVRHTESNTIKEGGHGFSLFGGKQK